VKKQIPAVLLTYVDGLRTHDIAKIAGTMAPELKFISATRILDREPALKMLTALYTGFPDWNYKYREVEDRGQIRAVRTPAPGRCPAWNPSRRPAKSCASRNTIFIIGSPTTG